MDFAPKQLPTNLEAEQAVLAAVLTDNRTLERLSDFLKPEHFSHPAHAEIYRTLERQFSAGLPANTITIKTYLEQQGALESVGGTGYLDELSSAGSSVVNVEQYGRIVFDAAIRRELIGVGRDITDAAYVEDPDNPVPSQIEVAEQKLFDLSARGETERGAVTMGTALKTAMEEAELAYKADGKLSGLTTGFTGLDKMIGGLHKSDLIIIAGRPAMGKTTIAMNIAFNAANALLAGNANKKFTGCVAFFSLEMSASQLATRVLASQVKISSSAMRNGNITDSDFLKMMQYSDALSRVPLFFDDTPGMSVPMMRARARRLHRKYGGLSLIVVDYLQLMTLPGNRRTDNRVQELSEITRGLKMLAKELDVPVIALSQLSRAVESRDDKRPLLSDLRESGSIEQDADLVAFTYREEYYLQNRDPAGKLSGRAEVVDTKSASWAQRLDMARGKGDLIIGKNRHGRIGTVTLRFEDEFTLFTDLETGDAPAYFSAPVTDTAPAHDAPAPAASGDENPF